MVGFSRLCSSEVADHSLTREAIRLVELRGRSDGRYVDGELRWELDDAGSFTPMKPHRLCRWCACGWDGGT
jgi:hypothetical protein